MASIMFCNTPMPIAANMHLTKLRQLVSAEPCPGYISTSKVVVADNRATLQKEIINAEINIGAMLILYCKHHPKTIVKLSNDAVVNIHSSKRTLRMLKVGCS